MAYTLTPPTTDVPDWWLASLGAELLPGQDLNQQSFSWFGRTFTLPIVAGPMPGRYLGLRAAQQSLGFPGWVVPLVLARVTTTAEQLTITLNGPTPWQWEERTGVSVLSLVAQLTGTLPTTNPKVTLLNSWPQLQLGFNVARPPRIQSFNNPYRLVLDFTQPPVPRTVVQVWRPGLTYQWSDFTNPKPQRVHLLTMDRSYPWQLVHAPDKKTLTSFAQAAGALAAINGGFFQVNSGQPLGAVRIAGQWRSGPILQRGVVAWDGTQTQFDRLDWQGVLILAQARLALVGWNSGYTRAGLSVYTPDWGSRYEGLTEGEVLVTIQDGYSQLLLRISRGTPVLIPPTGLLVVGRGYGADLLEQQLKDPQPVTLTLTLTPPLDLPNVLGGGPLLIKEGRMVLDAELEKFQPDVKDSRAPRTAVGRLSNGSLLWVMAEGRRGDAQGLTLPELATFMIRQGCVDALNLDGGGSSGLYLGRSLRNRRLGPERLLSTALLLMPV